MLTTYKIKPKTISGFIRAVSGVFISSSNPHGLTTKELKLITVLLSILPNQEEITKEVREQLCNLTNSKMQVMINCLNKLKKKGVIVKDKLHPIFYQDQIIIQWK